MDGNELLDVLNSTVDQVATFTGIKAQFTDAGWNEQVAEQMVLELLRAANITNSHA